MTEELLKIQVKDDQQLVSARDLHRGLGLTTRFSKWVEQNFKDFELGEDYTSVTAVTVVGNGGHKPIQVIEMVKASMLIQLFMIQKQMSISSLLRKMASMGMNFWEIFIC